MYISNEKLVSPIPSFDFSTVRFTVFCIALMDELKLMNHWGVVKKQSLADAVFDSWLASLGLAYTEKHLGNCGSGMSLTSEKTESGEIRKKVSLQSKGLWKKNWV